MHWGLFFTQLVRLEFEIKLEPLLLSWAAPPAAPPPPAPAPLF